MPGVVAPGVSTPGIAVRGLTVRYGSETVLRALDLDVEAGRLTFLLGPSGTGKTTLLRAIAGLAPPSAGTVAGTDGAPLGGRVAYMAQQDLLLPWSGALANVAIGDRLRGKTPDAARAREMLRRVGLGGRERARPAQLSGGERQRVALARTLYEDRPVVLLDEPFAALDAITRMRMQDLAAELLAGRTVLFVTHDPLEASRLGHRIVILAGAPPALTPAIVPPGAPPRRPDDPGLLSLQAELLRWLAA